MDKLLKSVARHPLFKPTFAAGLSHITTGIQLLMSLGIDIEDEGRELLQKIEAVLRNTAYDSINLDELLKQAQAIGDDFGKTRKSEKSPETFRPTEGVDSSEGNLNEPD